MVWQYQMDELKFFSLFQTKSSQCHHFGSVSSVYVTNADKLCAEKLRYLNIDAAFLNAWICYHESTVNELIHTNFITNYLLE